MSLKDRVSGWELVYLWRMDVSGISVSHGEMSQTGLWVALWPCNHGSHKQETVSGIKLTNICIDLNLQMMRLGRGPSERRSESPVLLPCQACVCVCGGGVCPGTCMPVFPGMTLHCVDVLYCYTTGTLRSSAANAYSHSHYLDIAPLHFSEPVTALGIILISLTS